MKRKWLHLLSIATIALVVVFVRTLTAATSQLDKAAIVKEAPPISPDYSDIAIPPNISPMNFRIEKDADKYHVKIHSSEGTAIEISGSKPQIAIPARKWRKLLKANRGNKLSIDVYLKDDNGWKRYNTITNTIAIEDIDPYLAYRLIRPLYNFWSSVGIYQRNLTNFDESEILHGRNYKNGCVNCHTFLNNDPSNMFIGIRSADYGSSTLHVTDGKVEKINTKWGYTSWHPSGKIAAYSINKVRLFFQVSGMEVRDVVDLDALLTYYDISKKEVKTNEGIADKQRLETYPTWSPDGKFLYFCSAPLLWEDKNTVPPEGYENVRYDLRRISYDIDTDTWGQPETVLSAEKTQKSILLPRITPDGKYLVFCMCDYGCFPIYQPGSDLYVMDLATGDYRKLDINSEFSESWHSFSSNSRWMTFSSKRRGGLFTRTHISYIDSEGKFHKPFVLPQKDPAFYDSFLKTYSVPELITGPVKISQKKLAKAVRGKEKIEVDLPISGATPRTSKPGTEYQDRE